MELYSFPSVVQTSQLEKMKDSKYLKKASEIGLPGFTTPSHTNKRQKTETAQSRSSHNQESTSGGIYDSPSVEERLSESGYHLIKEIDIPGWKSLNPVCFFLIVCCERIINHDM